jgi:hypothetical protein
LKSLFNAPSLQAAIRKAEQKTLSGISTRQLAADIDVSPSRISELVNGHRPIGKPKALMGDVQRSIFSRPIGGRPRPSPLG